MSESKTAKAARTAVAKSEAQKVKVVTSEEMVRQVRLHVAQGLFVSNMDYIAATVAALDKAEARIRLLENEINALGAKIEDMRGGVVAFAEQVNTLTTENADLRSKNEEFRVVYEMENRSTTLKVERIPGADDMCAARQGWDD